AILLSPLAKALTQRERGHVSGDIDGDTVREFERMHGVDEGHVHATLDKVQREGERVDDAAVSREMHAKTPRHTFFDVDIPCRSFESYSEWKKELMVYEMKSALMFW
ncbi:hypothetical protein ADUPG1_004941, partial [Aduncisulcus paluster]